jgi:hypothetical protein
MTDVLGGLWPYLVVVLVGFLPTELWRALAVVVSRGLDEDSEILVWVRAVAATLLAGVVAKLLYYPTGALAAVPLWGRGGAMVLGLAAFFALRRSVIAGVLVGVAAVVLAAWMAGV